jgi:predicted enzyme related to lactoylglutathione lyase
MKIGLLQINVTCLQKAKEFFVGVLGITHRESLGPEAPFELVLEGEPKVLVYLVDQPVVSEYENQGTTIVFYTDDLDGTMMRWKEKGVEFLRIPWSEEESGAAGCPFGRFIAFKDPFGNVFELLQPHA